MNTNPYHVPSGQAKIVCQTCQSENIHVDAWATWDYEPQMWGVDTVFSDCGTCDDCDGETQAAVVIVGVDKSSEPPSNPTLSRGR